MALLTKEQLGSRLIDAIVRAGWQVQRLSSAGEHPLRLVVGNDQRSLQVKANLWNVTHGGGAARPPDEYRIQITGDYSFQEEIGWRTLILGWWEEVQVFAAFDPRRHQGELGASPSIQIREDALRRAYVQGLATKRKENDEIAVAFRSDLLIYYLVHQEDLHAFAPSAHDSEVLEAVAADPGAVADSVVETVSAPRRRIVSEVRRVLRDRSFRERVLAAYQRRCAVCGLQLELVEAAHIVPVTFPTSSDSTSNGIAFCRNHHLAYDTAIIAIDPRYRVLLSESRAELLEKSNLHGGLDQFRAGLLPFIILPAEQTSRPRPDFLDLGASLRGWSE